MPPETLTLLSSGDKLSLATETMNREVRGKVREALKGSGVHPVAMYFDPLHPFFKRLGFGNLNVYRLTLAIKKGDGIWEERIEALQRLLQDWGRPKGIEVDFPRVKIASWWDELNGYVQNHGTTERL